MGGKVWSIEEERIFWEEIIPCSPNAANPAARKLSWKQCVDLMRERIGSNARRDYTVTMLYEHHYQNFKPGSKSHKTHKFMQKHLNDIEWYKEHISPPPPTLPRQSTWQDDPILAALIGDEPKSSNRPARAGDRLRLRRAGRKTQSTTQSPPSQSYSASLICKILPDSSATNSRPSSPSLPMVSKPVSRTPTPSIIRQDSQADRAQQMQTLADATLLLGLSAGPASILRSRFRRPLPSSPNSTPHGYLARPSTTLMSSVSSLAMRPPEISILESAPSSQHIAREPWDGILPPISILLRAVDAIERGNSNVANESGQQTRKRRSLSDGEEPASKRKTSFSNARQTR